MRCSWHALALNARRHPRHTLTVAVMQAKIKAAMKASSEVAATFVSPAHVRMQQEEERKAAEAKAAAEAKRKADEAAAKAAQKEQQKEESKRKASKAHEKFLAKHK